MEERRKRGKDMNLDTSKGKYLIEALMAMKPYSVTDNGYVPVSWVEIHAFMEATGRISEPWEAELLKEMSERYIQGMTDSKESLSVEPALRDQHQREL